MTRDEFQALLADCEAAGFTKVLTYGGWVPLREWHPYGEDFPRFVTMVRRDFEIVEYPSPHFPKFAPVMTGLWEMRGDADEIAAEQESNYLRGLGV